MRSSLCCLQEGCSSVLYITACGHKSLHIMFFGSTYRLSRIVLQALDRHLRCVVSSSAAYFWNLLMLCRTVTGWHADCTEVGQLQLQAVVGADRAMSERLFLPYYFSDIGCMAHACAAKWMQVGHPFRSHDFACRLKLFLFFFISFLSMFCFWVR